MKLKINLLKNSKNPEFYNKIINEGDWACLYCNQQTTI